MGDINKLRVKTIINIKQNKRIMKKKHLIIVIFIILILVGSILIWWFTREVNSIPKDDMPEVILGMTLGGNYREQIEKAKTNGMTIGNAGYYEITLDKNSIYPSNLTTTIKAYVQPKYIYDGTDSLLFEVNVQYISMDYGPFFRVTSKNFFSTPVDFENSNIDDIIVQSRNGNFDELDYYYLEENDINCLIKMLQSKYGKLKKVNDLSFLKDEDKDVKEIFYENDNTPKGFQWRLFNLNIYGQIEKIDITKKNGFPKPPEFDYHEYYVFNLNYTLSNDFQRIILDKNKKYEQGLKNKEINKSF